MADRIDIEIQDRISSSSGTLYRVVQKLGSGGNSNVYLALALEGPFRGVLFALKVFTKVAHADRLAKFKQEFLFLKSIDHPAIMRIYDEGTCKARTSHGGNELPFMVAEYLPDTLSEVLRTRMRTAEKLSITLQLLSALVHLHSQQSFVAHRDIKPQNIFLKGRSCVLGDFGLMRLGPEAQPDRTVFKESIGPGMPFFYRTPDLVAYAKNEADLTSKSDVFQLGLVICQLFTGRNPCKRSEDHLDEVELEEVKDIPGGHAAQIRELIQKMLTIDANSRPAAADLMDTFEGLFREVVYSSHQLDGRVF